MALIAQYLFNGNANDETGSYNGTASNLAYENAPSGYNFGSKVAIFNGSSSKIDLPNITPISGTNARTIEFWQFSNINNQALQFTFTSGDGAQNGAEFSTALVSESTWNKPIATIAGIITEFGRTTPIGSWHHHAFTIGTNGNASTIKYYLDGILQTNHTTDTTAINTSNNNFGIGYRRRSTAFYLNGKIGNLRVWNEELSQATIQSHFDDEKAPESVTLIAQYLWRSNCNSETGSYNGTGSRMLYALAPTGYNFNSNVAMFDGWSNTTQTSISFASYNWNSTWSVETWYYRDHASNTDLFMHAGTTVGSNQYLHMGINENNKLRLGFYGNDLDAPGTYTDANWHHLVFTYDSSTRGRQIFCDGELVASDVSASALNATSTWYLGWYQSEKNFCGGLANTRIYSGILSDFTIAQHYNQEKADIPMSAYNYTGSIQTFTAPVKGYYKLEAWGAAGNGNGSYGGGVGGYSVGVALLDEGETLYIGVGGRGTVVSGANKTANGGYNGGGNGRTYSSGSVNTGSGGGATHFAATTGTLASLSSNQLAVVMVAGGGGGGHFTNQWNYGQGGNAGGYIGGGGLNYGSDNLNYNDRQSQGGTQLAGGTNKAGGMQGSFGQGFNFTGSNGVGGGGGGGWYGGSGANLGPGGSGSGYIASSKLETTYDTVTKHMTGYAAQTSSDPDTRTQAEYAAHWCCYADSECRASGLARVTFLAPYQPPTSDFNTAALLLMMV